MSARCCVEYRGRAFWGYEQSVAILLYLAAERAESAEFVGDFTPQMIEQWRFVSFLGSNIGVQLDGVCADEHRRLRFIELLSSCGDELQRMKEVRGEQVLEWRALGERVIWRESPGSVVSTMPIAMLAEAMTKLVRGDLPHPPPETWWSIGWHIGEFGTIGMWPSDLTG